MYEVLSDIMQAEGMNQADVASALGVSQATVSRWVSGKKVPARDSAVRLVIWSPDEYRASVIEWLFPPVPTAPEIKRAVLAAAGAAVDEIMGGECPS